MPKAHFVGMPLIVIAVAVPSFVAFIVTQQNGVDSIDMLSMRLANATMYAVSSQIRKRLQDEPETEIRSVKEALEVGARTLERSEDEYWVRRSHDWLKFSGIFTMALNILVLDDAGPYGGGVMVDSPVRRILYYSPPTYTMRYMYDNSTVFGPTLGPVVLLLNNRPYVTLFDDDADLIANKPRWTDTTLTISNSNSGLGPFFRGY
ncbi:hypothetical protein DIPPA_25189 [Diplonema papillatum]|nr:hypothetical protein DIPPA_25189 [Diplonema papillatum]